MTLNIGQAQVIVELDANKGKGLQGGNRNNIQSMPPGALKPSASDLRHYGGDDQ